ncbi:hypothetical protein [uncultured Methylovirgula sp.]|uniref:hypothetical protein n=1 Tax=uncultured Methylovirgula sp. TaxID=1285960 RepID=UPI00260B4B07|nr:hypothetical protein [uncultured Methylovirgula sp.]
MNANDRLAALMPIVVNDDELHARWLNTFSYLEYVGFRKIIKSQRADVLSRAFLNHALEEGGHAFLLKNMAVKVGGKAFDYYKPETMLCAEAARAYFQTLDHGCDEKFASLPDLERSQIVYHYVTWLIERRALDVYGRYKNALGASPLAAQLDDLLGEEVGHLRQVEALLAASDPDHEKRAPALEAFEQDLFSAFVAALAQEIAPAKHPA